MHDDDEVVVVVAVLDVNLHAGVGHHSGHGAELAGCLLIQSQQDDLTGRNHRQSCSGKDGTGGLSVIDEEVRDTDTAMSEHTAAFQAHPSGTERLTKVCQRTDMVR